MNTNPTSTPRTGGLEDVAVSIATRVSTLVSSIAIQSLLAYALLPAGRGEFAVCILFAGLLGITLTPGADAGVQYFVMAKRISVSRGVSAAFSICLVGTIIAATLTVPLVSSEIPFFRKAEPQSFRLALILIPLTTFSNSLQHQLAGLRRFKHLALFSLIQIAANGVSLLALVVGMGLGVDGALLAGCTANLFMILSCIRHLRRNDGLTLVIPSRLDLARILRYGLKYYVARVGWGGDARVGLLILGMLADRTEIGLFAVASGVMSRFLMIPNAISVPLLPRSTLDETGRPDLVAFCARVATWVTCLAIVPMIVFDTELVSALFSTEFIPAVTLIRIIAPGLLLYAGASVFTAYFRGMNRPDICSWAVGVGIAVNIIAVPLLYPEFGVAAGAWGMTLGLIVRSTLLSVVYYNMTCTSPWVSWMPQRGDILRIQGLVRHALSRVLRRTSGHL